MVSRKHVSRVPANCSRATPIPALSRTSNGRSAKQTSPDNKRQNISQPWNSAYYDVVIYLQFFNRTVSIFSP